MSMEEMLQGRFQQLTLQMHEGDAFDEMMSGPDPFMVHLYKVFCCGAVLGAMMSEREDVADAIVERSLADTGSSKVH